MTDPKDRIWVDGCFDFTHHGHLGALCQARALGKELYVGVHSDEEILKCKGPVVMHLPERVMAVEACRWVTRVVPGAPYVTDYRVLDEYGCWYVAHGDDITTDADGNDCYQEVKDLGRYKEFQRTPNISTTDLIQRMLSMSKTHHLPALTAADSGHPLRSVYSTDRFRMYAQDASARKPHACVLAMADGTSVEELMAPSMATKDLLAKNAFYIDGGWDLFYSGHIEVLKEVRCRAEGAGAAVVVGIRSDEVLNQARGENYPIMNVFERALCVLQCRYVDAVVIDAPFFPNSTYLDALAGAGVRITRVFKGPVSVISNRGQRIDTIDPYKYVKLLGIWEQLPPGKFSDVRYDTIVDRVLKHRRQFEERQKRKLGRR